MQLIRGTCPPRAQPTAPSRWAGRRTTFAPSSDLARSGSGARAHRTTAGAAVLPGIPHLHRPGLEVADVGSSVAQSCTLLCRGFEIRRHHLLASAKVFPRALPSPTRRNNRVQLCATCCPPLRIATRLDRDPAAQATAQQKKRRPPERRTFVSRVAVPYVVRATVFSDRRCSARGASRRSPSPWDHPGPAR